MNNYVNKADAIYDLHKQGFTSDFQLNGNDLLCVQEDVNIRMGDFVITEYHRVEECLVFGIIALHYGIKGILLSRSEFSTDTVPPSLIKKMKELELLERFQAI